MIAMHWEKREGKILEDAVHEGGVQCLRTQLSHRKGQGWEHPVSVMLHCKWCTATTDPSQEYI